MVTLCNIQPWLRMDLDARKWMIYPRPHDEVERPCGSPKPIVSNDAALASRRWGATHLHRPAAR